MPENFVRRFEATARRFADRPAILWDGGALTYRELAARAGGFARFLAHRGVKAGDRVALDIPNRWPFPVAFLGALTLGATAAPLDPRLTGEERRAIVDDLAPAVVAHEVVGDEAAWPTADPVETPALILYTSGSTGRPKGAVLSHGALGFAVESWADPVMALGPDDVVLAVLPFSHSFGLNGALLAPLLTGAQVVLLERFSPEAALRAIRDHGVTVFPGVATMFRRLLDLGVGRSDVASLRVAVSGAAPCPWELAEEWRERTGVRIVRGYGMTELFRPISYLARDPTDRPDAIGRAVPGVEVRIVDDEGRALGPGEAGELLIRSPAAMDGYWGAPEETCAVLENGWFRTGDLATVTAEGLVRIEGRKRERILRGGYSVFPAEVEAALLAHPAVAEAAVVGVAHAELGEEVAAFVVLQAGARAGADELAGWCKERLAAFKYPRRVTIVGELPKGPTGKVLKAKLAAQRPA
ncbi:MAG: AMP-binding protein [Candidatus Rokubacteria bacterium]|nr:AMP-binding protein [Candidatus Rokubacteria bacterium]